MEVESLQRQTKDYKVLYAEDSATIRNITKKMMSSYFNHIDVAKDGQEALDMYTALYDETFEYYDIVITDLEMPNMGGQELAQEILSMDFTQELIVVSGVTDFKVITSLVNDGITKFLSKPIEDESFYDIIESVTYSLQIKEMQQKEAQELERTNAILKQKDEENRIELKAKVDELKVAMQKNEKIQKAKEDFFTNMSHEMKTPLNSILGFSSILQKHLKDDEKSLMMVNAIFETGTDLNKLLASILDMQKLQDGSLMLVENSFNPVQDISKLVKIYEKKSQEKLQSMEYSIDTSMPNILIGNTDRVLQVIEIVLDNAVKFTPQNGKIKIDTSYDEVSNLLTCIIIDNGIGIAKADQQRIYKLEQLDATASRSSEGTGLGLNIAYNIIKIMKGKISLKSVPDKGSLFELEFPLTK